MKLQTTVTDSNGETFKYATIRPAIPNIIIIATYPAHAATAFSAAVAGGRCVACTADTMASAQARAQHHARQFGAFDIEFLTTTKGVTA
jgi:hypothetical protein